ncbi:MAG TPA: Spy/CpxP family protein refolding chaperone [Rhizobacter sp.]|nr:Spy/CpxP family protein refolding chaperone [Rhizobacter sp.]
MFAAETVKAAGTHGTRGIKRATLGLLMALVGSVAVTAWAQPHGGPRGGGDFGGGFGGPGLFMGPSEHVGRGVDRLLEGLNATDAQRTQIKQIAQAAATDLKAQHDAARGQHERGLELFTAPVVDARAVETLRQQRLAQHDQASKRVTQALLDIANVLTPEQRVKLGERIKQREQRMHERMQRRAASAPAQ